MAMAFKCDICKRYFSIPESGAIDGLMFFKSCLPCELRIKYSLNRVEMKEIDCCPDCATKINDFLLSLER